MNLIRKICLYVFLSLCIWIFLSRCVIMRNRWSDSKASRIFAAKNVPLGIHDTIIEGRHLHYSVSGSPDLPTLVFIHGSPGSWMNYMRFMCDPEMQKKFRMVSIDRPGFG